MDDEMTVIDLKKKIEAKEDFFLLDVREEDEYEICAIDGADLVPMSEFEERIQAYDKTKAYVVQCKVGGRSARAQQYMLDQGFSDVKNLKGGIDAWIDEIDPSLTSY